MAIKASILLLSPLEVQSTWTYEKSDFSQYSPEMIFPENFNESWSCSVWELSEGFQATWLILSIQRWFPFLGKGVLFVVLVSVMLFGDSPVVVMSMPFFLSRQPLHVVHSQKNPALSCSQGNNSYGCKPHLHLQCTSAWFVASHHLTFLDFRMTFCKL